MADFTRALTKRLLENEALAGLVGAKIHWGAVPAKTALPYIRLQTISDGRPMDLEDYTVSRETRVQADCFGASFGSARTTAEAVIAATKGPAVVDGVRFGRTKAEGPRDLGEDTPTGYVHRASLDLIVEHRPV